MDKVGSTRNFVSLEAGVLISAIVIIVAFFIIFGHTSIWYDEATYLTISAAIKEMGYPFWFWDDPDRPYIFLNSPPGLFYVVSIISRFYDDLFFLRAVYITLSIVPPFIVLLWYIRKKNLDLIFLSMTAIYCAVTWYFMLEVIQIRMDLPLASLSFLALPLVALAEDQFKQNSKDKLKGSAHRWLWLTFVLLASISALSFLTKFQAVCLTGTLILSALLDWQDFRKLASWLPLTAHLAGAAIGVFVLVLVVMSNPVMPGIDVISDTLRSNLRRIGGSSSRTDSMFMVVKDIVPMAIVPTVLFIIARSTGRVDWKNDRLLRLCVLMLIVVIAFNIAVYRMPGAGDYYMIQAAIPMGYIFARSFESLFSVKRTGTLLALVALLTLHAMFNARLGSDSPQRWDNGLYDLVGPNARLDSPKLVADNLAPFLRSEDVLLLDNHTSQNLAVPYWLKRSHGYAYLLQMNPIKAESLLQRKGSGRVGALVFFGDNAYATLASGEQWSGVKELLDRDFVRLPQVQNAPGWITYLRRTD